MYFLAFDVCEICFSHVKGGRGTEELERERKMHSSAARAMPATALPRRTDQMGAQPGTNAGDFNSKYFLSFAQFSW